MPGTRDLITAFEDLEEARPAYIEASDMYAGNVGEVFASPKVKALLKRRGVDQLDEWNYARIPVDTVANRLEITSVAVVDKDAKGDNTDGGETSKPEDAKAETAEVGGETQRKAAPAKDAKPAAAQKALDQILKDNQLDFEAKGLHKKVARDGDCYLIVWPRSDDDGKALGVDVRVNTAMTTRVLYDDEDPLKIAMAIKSWTFDAPEKPNDPDSKVVQFTRVNLYYDNRIERYISLPGKKGKALCKPESWQQFDGDGKPWKILHDYGRVPVFHFRNDRPYGQPAHLYAYGPQQFINKLIPAMATQVDYESFPQRYALMDPATDQPMGNLLDPNHPEDDDDPEGDGNVSALSSEPSAVWRFHGAKTVGQFEPAGPDVFLKPFDRAVQAMAELTETPLYRFGSAFAQTPSGAALRQADSPTTNKVEDWQASLDATWEDAYEFALKLLGHEVKVKVSWKPAEQATDFEAWSVVQSKRDAGVPQKQTLIETGYTDDQVDEWMSGEEAKNAALKRRVDLLTSLADALQAVGAASAMGVVDEGQVQALIGGLFAPDEAALADAGDRGA